MAPTSLPSYTQFLLSTVLLLGLSILSFPLSLFATLSALCLRRRETRPKSSKTVLVNGAKMYKSLGMVRAFGKAGCRVIVTESGVDGYFSATRFSRYASTYYRLPIVTPGDESSATAYVRTLAAIAQKEKVDIFVPCSGAGTTIEDAKAGRIMSKQSDGRCKVFIPSPDLTKELHEKDLFMELCKSLELPTPESHLVDDPKAALEITKQSAHPMILKATAVLDDLGRNDMTNYPLPGDQGPDYPKTMKRFQSGLSVPMQPKTPYVLQQFVRGSEWCTHATVYDGKLVALVCCPSNDMLMRYENHTDSTVGKKAEAWTRQFLESWTKSDRGQRETLQGHFSMDFILSNETGELFPIECNPRIHTAICLLANQATDFAKTYLDAPTFGASLKPLSKTRPCSWIGHDLPALYGSAFLPLTTLLHPYWEKTSWKELKTDSIDPTWDKQDPLPFLILYHLQWPQLLLKQLYKGNRWVRINASTARIFEIK